MQITIQKGQTTTLSRMSKEEKLDWIYKNANSLVDREEYLIGRKVDKTLEQLNEEEKVKKFVLPTPKNHVEHECIPPSIRDFNKIVQSEQVDLSAKLQEDPLVAIKKREEEARRQFLQNPVQLKKLQDALMKKGEKKKKKKSKNRSLEASLDQQIREKLKSLKSGQLGVGAASKKDMKKEKDDVLNTILMHKFNALKDKLSEDDLQDILNGKISDTSSDEGTPKKKYKEYDSSESEGEGQKRIIKSSSKYHGRKSRSRSKSRSKPDKDNQRTRSAGSRNKRHSSSEDEIHHDRKGKERQAAEERSRSYRKRRSRSRSRTNSRRRDNSGKRENQERSSKDYLENRKVDKQCTNRKLDRNDESSDSELRSRRNSRKRDYSRRGDDRESYLENTKAERQYTNRNLDRDSTNSNDESSDSELDKKIMERLKLLREENESRLNTKGKSDNTSDSKKEVPHYRYSDSDDEKPHLKSFGLVTSDGKKIALKRREEIKKVDVRPANKIEESAKPQGKQVKRMTEAEKEQLRKEMMQNAKQRDREREENVRRYREKDKKEEELVSKKYDADIIHTELLKTAKHSSVEERIKSNLANIQRSSRHMDQNFSKR